MAQQPKPADQPAASKNFRVLHTQVGPFTVNSIVTSEQLAQHNADTQRLLDLKAIEPADAPATGATPLVPDEIARQQAAAAKQAEADEKAGKPAVGSVADAARKGPVLP